MLTSSEGAETESARAVLGFIFCGMRNEGTRSRDDLSPIFVCGVVELNHVDLVYFILLHPGRGVELSKRISYGYSRDLLSQRIVTQRVPTTAVGQHGRGSAERTGQARPRSPHTQGGDGRGRGRPRRSRGEWVCDTSLCAQNALVVLACMLRWRRRVAGRQQHLPAAPCRRNGDQFGTDSTFGSNSGSRPT